MIQAVNKMLYRGFYYSSFVLGFLILERFCTTPGNIEGWEVGRGTCPGACHNRRDTRPTHDHHPGPRVAPADALEIQDEVDKNGCEGGETDKLRPHLSGRPALQARSGEHDGTERLQETERYLR